MGAYICFALHLSTARPKRFEVGLQVPIGRCLAWSCWIRFCFGGARLFGQAVISPCCRCSFRSPIHHFGFGFSFAPPTELPSIERTPLNFHLPRAPEACERLCM